MDYASQLQANYQRQKDDVTHLAKRLIALRQNNVQLSFFGEHLTGEVGQLLTLHIKHRHDPKQSLDYLDGISQHAKNARFDLGLAQLSGKNTLSDGDVAKKPLVLFGFGRIGRILARLLLAHNTPYDLTLKAIVLRPARDTATDLAKRASLLARDSVHGWFDGAVQADSEQGGLLVNGQFVKIIYANSPSEVDYTQHGIDGAILIDNTGKFKDREGLGQHLTAGIDKVLLTAPASGDIKNVVFGVNNSDIGDDTIVSAASCTTNAITPLLKLLNDQYGIVNGHMETIHAFTNDQNLVDNHHNAERRGRAAPLNMVMTSTGAAKAVGKALPELQGKLTGNAIRVPTPNVSLAVLTLNLSTSVTADEINAFVKQCSQTEQWQQQIAYSDSPEAVSTDFVGEKKVAIFDAKATLCDGKLITVYVWYDNEMGYSTQVLRVAEQMAGIVYGSLG